MPLSEQQRSRYRDATEPWRKWYKTKRWAELRLQVFVRDLFTCKRKECGRIEGNTSLLVAHHKRPHRGDETLFWDPENITTVCKDCHDGPIQAQERKEHITGNWY
ncbi:HNH endonuclease signature motif containing protein [Taklimakanibacter deserti]|uniref:HNH endonuclease signature motif containing protein n=1 Tax=Taklimakanibacter deserti TaxID=2267839 RepID=UPI000E64D7EB